LFFFSLCFVFSFLFFVFSSFPYIFIWSFIFFTFFVSLTGSSHQGELVDGIQITQLLKANPETNAVPVILVTAHAMQGDRETFLAKSGAEGYISKPVVDYDDFLGQIRGLVAH
jgi:DNA-binding NarL/FixJ family response regulator